MKTLTSFLLVVVMTGSLVTTASAGSLSTASGAPTLLIATISSLVNVHDLNANTTKLKHKVNQTTIEDIRETLSEIQIHPAKKQEMVNEVWTAMSAQLSDAQQQKLLSYLNDHELTQTDIDTTKAKFGDIDKVKFKAG